MAQFIGTVEITVRHSMYEVLVQAETKAEARQKLQHIAEDFHEITEVGDWDCDITLEAALPQDGE